MWTDCSVRQPGTPQRSFVPRGDRPAGLTELPDVCFLVVESRATRESAARHLHVDWAGLPNVDFLRQQPDLSTAFTAARILLFPALRFAAAPRILVEANHAAVPVISSAHGGSPEMLDGAGFLIDVDPRYREDPTTLPDGDAVTPWVDHLKLLWCDQQAWKSACARAAVAAGRHDLEALARAFGQ